MDLSKLFSNIETESVGDDLLPPGFEKPAESTTEKISLRFPTRPGMKKADKSTTQRTKPSGPPPFVPKIKSFSDR